MNRELIQSVIPSEWQCLLGFFGASERKAQLLVWVRSILADTVFLGAHIAVYDTFEKISVLLMFLNVCVRLCVLVFLYHCMNLILTPSLDSALMLSFVGDWSQSTNRLTNHPWILCLLMPSSWVLR